MNKDEPISSLSFVPGPTFILHDRVLEPQRDE